MKPLGTENSTLKQNRTRFGPWHFSVDDDDKIKIKFDGETLTFTTKDWKTVLNKQLSIRGQLDQKMKLKVLYFMSKQNPCTY